jgi:ABC-2 type transport system permease protein
MVVLGLVGLIGLATACSSYALALALGDEDSFAPVVLTATLPLLLLSGVLLPLSLAPAWLQAIARVNPLSYAVDAARAVFNNQVGGASVVRGVVILLVLTIASIAVAGRSFNRTVS